ncbi:MAG: hypothetical protein ABSE41_06075 [Bacteroidota bacterium]|jgi:hypothetical protein
MVEAAYIIIIFGFLTLGVMIFRKFREIASWKSEDELEGGQSAGSLPRDLQELRIEEPGGEPGSLDGIDENKSEQH